MKIVENFIIFDIFEKESRMLIGYCFVKSLKGRILSVQIGFINEFDYQLIFSWFGHGRGLRKQKIFAKKKHIGSLCLLRIF